MAGKYTWVFSVGTVAALAESFNNGANDVANAWAAPVAGRAISYRKAMLMALFFETSGALLLGGRNANTIKNGIIEMEAWRGNASVAMLVFTIALLAAAAWGLWCTRHSLHVSSTYALIASVAASGIAVGGAKLVHFDWHEGRGLLGVFSGIIIAPGSGALAAAILYRLLNFIVFSGEERDRAAWAIYISPFIFALNASVCMLAIVHHNPELTGAVNTVWYEPTIILSNSAGIAVLTALFFIPFMRARVLLRDSTLKWWMFLYGPLLLKRAVPVNTETYTIPDYGFIQEETEKAPSAFLQKDITEAISPTADVPQTDRMGGEAEIKDREDEKTRAAVEKQSSGCFAWSIRSRHENGQTSGTLFELENMILFFKRLPATIVYYALYGFNYDIHAARSAQGDTPEGKRLAAMYQSAKRQPNEVEHVFSYIQIVTACTASFAHGANDSGNAAGPWAAINQAWKTGDIKAMEQPVVRWQMLVLSTAMSVGLLTYGYRIMAVMGNKITTITPTRGVVIQLAGATTVLVSNIHSIPVSTSMCMVGSSVGVGLASNMSWKAVNFPQVGRLFLGWLFTMPVAGFIAFSLVAILINAPHFS